MKSFDSRTYSINDFVEWEKQGQLLLNPFFQRRAVWSETAKSYLIDTILRGKPIPKVFIRQQINVTTKTSVREVVDGQQRLRTILSYVKDGFRVLKRHNTEYEGLYFSQLPEEVQAQILSYEVAVDLLINMPDAEVLDVFGRLNSYAITLNEQEKINASHFSEFKVLADSIGYKYNKFWLDQKILTPSAILRMQEISLVADLLISMLEGIKSKKQIRRFYALYERAFGGDIDELSAQFDDVIEFIFRVYPEGISGTEFKRVHLFYTLFTAIYHVLFGLKGLDGLARPEVRSEADIARVRNAFDRIGGLFEAADGGGLDRSERQFIQDSRRATTDEPVRERRTKFLISLIQ